MELFVKKLQPCRYNSRYSCCRNAKTHSQINIRAVETQFHKLERADPLVEVRGTSSDSVSVLPWNERGHSRLPTLRRNPRQMHTKSRTSPHWEGQYKNVQGHCCAEHVTNENRDSLPDFFTRVSSSLFPAQALANLPDIWQLPTAVEQNRALAAAL